MSSITRRQFLRSVAGTGVVLTAWPLVSACGIGAPTGQEPKVLRVMMNGGNYETQMRSIIFEPFQKANNVTIEIVPGTSAEMLTRVRAEKAAPTIDAVVWDDIVAVSGRADGLAEKIDPANVPNLKDLDPRGDYKDGFGPAIHGNVACVAYNTANVKVEPPKTMKDIWDPKYKGTIFTAGINTTVGVMFLNLANKAHGGNYENIEPGFDAVKRLQPNMFKYYAAVAETTPVLRNDPVIGFVGIDQPQQLAKEGLPIKIIYPENMAGVFPAAFDIIKGTKAKGLAEKLLNFYLEPANQAAIAKAMTWITFNTKAPVAPEVKAVLPTNFFTLEPASVAKYREQWVERWKREIGG